MQVIGSKDVPQCIQARTARNARFTRLYDLLDEILECHRVMRVLDTDKLSELGEALGDTSWLY